MAFWLLVAAAGLAPYNWSQLQAHARNQAAFVEAGLYPRRTQERNADYDRYKAWCEARGLSNHEYVLRYVAWTQGAALEPALAPYELTEGIEHWILWHHPAEVPGDRELDPRREEQLALKLLALERVHPAAHQILSFQNVPSLRSIPTIAHSHVFVRSRPASATATGLANIRRRWRERSPWLTRSD